MPTRKPTTERRHDYSQLADIAAKVDEIISSLNEMRQTEAARIEREKVIAEKVAALDGIVNGNGKPGIKTDLRLAQEQIARASIIGGLITAAIVADVISRVMAK